MAKGQTTQPLVIWVFVEWEHHPAIEALREAGHTIVPFFSTDDLRYSSVTHVPDLILHPAAWRWGEWAWPYLNQAIMEARRAKRAREAGA